MKDFEKNSKSSDYRERWLDAAEFVPVSASFAYIN